jgi:hypothetical protein
MNNSFKKFYLNGKSNSLKALNDTEKSYLTKIVESAEMIYIKNKTLPADVLLDLSIKSILRDEMEMIEKQIKNAAVTALDIIKEKYPKEEIQDERQSKNPN